MILAYRNFDVIFQSGDNFKEGDDVGQLLVLTVPRGHGNSLI